MAEISIIVPVYKVEAFLERCVRSVTAQTFSDIEILLVDDGSPDACGEICEALAKEDGRIRVFHKKNGGLSDARNYGIAHATAPLLGFVDSDDFIAPDMYECLYRNLTEYNADVAICGSWCVYNGQIPTNTRASRPELLSAEQAAERILSPGGPGMYAWNKLYKREIFDTIRYPVGRYYEDTYIILEVLLRCRRVVVDRRPGYCYYQNPKSITHAEFQPQHYDVLRGAEHNLELLKKHFPRLVAVGELRMFVAHKEILSVMAKSPKAVRRKYRTERRKLAAFVRKNLRKPWKNPYATDWQRKYFALYALCPSLLMTIFRRFDR